MTQMSEARKGNITKEMLEVAEFEGRTPEFIREEIARGTLIIPANIHHIELGNFRPVGIGKAIKTKVNANIGTSTSWSGLEEELEKLEIALKFKSDTIMDLSTGGDLMGIRAAILKHCYRPLGTVPIYEAMHRVNNDPLALTKEILLDVIEDQAKQGVDYMTIHAGVLREHGPLLMDRIGGIVSRGGSIMFRWMTYHKKQNLLFEAFDEICEIFKAYDVSFSLGDSLRPGCLADASDEAQFAELKVLGDLTRQAWRHDVQVMVEGPGHVPFDQIKMNMELEDQLCDGAPFYVLGPLVTDIAPGYDHITSAIGGTMAAASGAAMLCYVTPKEHLGLPEVEDVKQGVIAMKIAAHAGDIANQLPGVRDRDDELSRHRHTLNWDKHFALAMDPEHCHAVRDHQSPDAEALCTMCEDFCSYMNFQKSKKDIESMEAIENDGHRITHKEL